MKLAEKILSNLEESKKKKEISLEIRGAKTEKDLRKIEKMIDDLAQKGEIKFKEASALLRALSSKQDKLGLGL